MGLGIKTRYVSYTVVVVAVAQCYHNVAKISALYVFSPPRLSGHSVIMSKPHQQITQPLVFIYYILYHDAMLSYLGIMGKNRPDS